MSLLEFARVGKGYGGCSVLEDVSLELDPGEMVVVLGERQSGRSTLLRLAAGVEAPDSGIVRFDGRPLDEGTRLGNEIGYCRLEFRVNGGRTVVEQLMSSQAARSVPAAIARRRALSVLNRVAADHCGALAIADLKVEERLRVGLARALCSSPWLVVIDEPTIGLDAIRRDEILELLRSLADDGIAVLASAGDGSGLLGAHRVLSLDKGTLRGDLTPTRAVVSDLAGHRQRRA